MLGWLARNEGQNEAMGNMGSRKIFAFARVHFELFPQSCLSASLRLSSILSFED